MTRKAVVSYAIDASRLDKRRQLLEGFRDCAVELRELGVDRRDIVDELEQVANDVEQGDCDA
jgi:hypothetical protein